MSQHEQEHEQPQHASPRTHQRIALAHHLILTLYGHWPPNDNRGSGSADFRDDKFAALGPIHHGRKPAHEQPTRGELRAFHKQVQPLLNYPIFWIDDAKRQACADAIREVLRANKYTCYACAICANHLHLLIRRHRDDWQIMWRHLVNALCAALRGFDDLSDDHPVISNRPYAVYAYDPEGIRARIDYIERNPEKEGLARQHHDFVTAYDGWPFAKKSNRMS